MPEVLTLEAWRRRLEGKGHRVTSIETGFRLWPTPDTIITVAVDPDPTLREAYRQRYFLCELEPEQVFGVMGCPEPHRTRWQELVPEQPEGYWRDFMAGPGAWTLSLLTRFREVVAWSERGLHWEGLDAPDYRSWGMVIPKEAAPFFAGVDPLQPRSFHVGDRRFPDAVAACFLFATVGLRDCYLADVDGEEVYLAHHHDKVVVSIPRSEVREEALAGLRSAPWLFSDVSGYGSSVDDSEE